MDREMWRQWLHGFLDLCLLSLLAEQRDYGRGLAERLAQAGLDDVPGGTMYPALLRLEKQGLVKTDRVASASGPPRKYYDLTPLGLAAMEERKASWLSFRAAVDAVVDASAGAPAPASSSVLDGARQP